MRLVEVAAKEGCNAFLVQRSKDIDWSRLDGAGTVGITAGASAPEILVQEVLKAFRERYDVSIEEVRTTDENIQFKLPAALTA
jgi:4-hydroxy-3-methylbut-2-enyl diphosphate reductase